MTKIAPLPCLLALCALSAAGCGADQGGWQNAAQSAVNAALSGGAGGGANGAALTSGQIALGLREALGVGTQTVVAKLDRAGGFNLDPVIRIPLPAPLAKVDAALTAIGMGALTDDLQNRMNEAAELAVPQAKELFLNAIGQMTIADARGILSGGQDAATQYLRKTMGTELGVKIQPVIAATLAQAGAVQAYERVTGQYAALLFVADIKTDLNRYVTDKALDGIFYYVAQEEAAIRQNPAKRTTEILRAVFGQQDGR